MNKTVVSYKGFRLSKLNEPRFRHLKLLLFWPVTLALFFITGHCTPIESCTPMHMFLDDLIPFCEWFLIPYAGWYFLIAISLIWFLRRDVESFKRLQTFIAISQLTCTLIYIIWPTCHQLRPDFAALGRDNILIDGVKLLYSVDTTANACPSLHATLALGIAIAVWQSKHTTRFWKIFVAVFAALVCMSITFVKQHSAVDFFAALPMTVVAQTAVHFIFRKKKSEVAL